jgi:hypothetical protein
MTNGSPKSPDNTPTFEGFCYVTQNALITWQTTRVPISDEFEAAKKNEIKILKITKDGFFEYDPEDNCYKRVEDME